MDPGAQPHPCLACGACCACFRVSFYWREADPEQTPLPVPSELTEDYNQFKVSMKGTNSKHHSRCVALEGKVGEGARCSIYSLRPSPCRDFEASFEYGDHKPRCDQARARHGLEPLKLKDWMRFREAERLSANESSCYHPPHEHKFPASPEVPASSPDP